MRYELKLLTDDGKIISKYISENAKDVEFQLQIDERVRQRILQDQRNIIEEGVQDGE